MRKFSSSFMIGAATAAHQVEGNNVNSDYFGLIAVDRNTQTRLPKESLILKGM